MRKRRIVSILFAIAFLLTSMNTIIYAKDSLATDKYTVNEKYVVSIKPGTAEWINLGSHLERIESCQIPEKLLKKMTTEALVESVLSYPFMLDMLAFNSYTEGYQSVFEDFNGLRELVSRKDAGIILSTKYETFQLSEKMSFEDYTQFIIFEILLAQTEITSCMKKNELVKLEKITEGKYLYKCDHENFFGPLTTLYYDAKKENSIRKISKKSNKTNEIGVRDYSSSVLTPEGTSIPVYIMTYELSAAVIDYNDWYVENYYPGVTLVRSSTRKYNCHSYAWYSTSSSNYRWMDYPYNASNEGYMTDGSYTQGTVQAGYKVYYAGTHSGIVYGVGQYDFSVQSKWGQLGLVIHASNDCPYSGSKTFWH